MNPRKTTVTSTRADTAPARGRPTFADRRTMLLEQYGEEKLKSLDGELGKPCETITSVEFEVLYKSVSAEKGWGSTFKPAF